MNHSMTWRELAACKDEPTSTFFPDCEPGGNFDYSAALAICATCTVRSECLDENIDQLHGVFGQTTPRERGEIAKRRAEMLNCANCGTPVPRASRGGTLAWCHEQDCRRVRIRDAQRRLRARGAA